jgi:UDP-sugar diphosphatase
MIKLLDSTDDFDPKFVRPRLISFEQDGKRKSWEVLDVFDSVAVLIYHKTKDAFVLVKQFRPAVYLKNSDGYTYELCAGIVDKDCSLIQIIKEEIFEECGYEVELKDIEQICEFFTSVGFAGGKQNLYYCEVDDGNKIGDGGGVEEEDIDVVYLPVSEAREFIYDSSKVKTTGLMFAFMWFFDRQ